MWTSWFGLNFISLYKYITAKLQHNNKQLNNLLLLINFYIRYSENSLSAFKSSLHNLNMK